MSQERRGGRIERGNLNERAERTLEKETGECSKS